MKQSVEVLQNIPLFFGIRQACLPHVLGCLQGVKKQYTKQEFILHAGDLASAIGILISGRIHIVREELTGERSMVAELVPGDLFAEAFCFAQSDDARRLPNSVLAAEASSVMFLDYHNFLDGGGMEAEFHNRLIANMMNALAQKNIMLNRKIGHLSRRTTREKLMSYLSEQAILQGKRQIVVPFDRQTLADYLCVDRSAMSTVLSRLQAEGILEVYKNEFVLL